jgi:hypothetical protein
VLLRLRRSRVRWRCVSLGIWKDSYSVSRHRPICNRGLKKRFAEGIVQIISVTRHNLALTNGLHISVNTQSSCLTIGRISLKPTFFDIMETIGDFSAFIHSYLFVFVCLIVCKFFDR